MPKLEMKTGCERCSATFDDGADAFICTYECTFCSTCTTGLRHVCPNCGGELVRRPRVGPAAVAVQEDELSPPGVIETDRLRLRPPVMNDAQAIYREYASDPEVTKYLMWRPHRSVEETRAFLHEPAAAWQARDGGRWVITRKTDDALLGMLALRINGNRADLGYVLARRFWGQGYTAEAVAAVVEWALAQPSIFRVWAVCDVDNPASARVMEKVGMQREGVLRRWNLHPGADPGAPDVPRDCICYARVK